MNNFTLPGPLGVASEPTKALHKRSGCRNAMIIAVAFYGGLMLLWIYAKVYVNVAYDPQGRALLHEGETGILGNMQYSRAIRAATINGPRTIGQGAKAKLVNQDIRGQTVTVELRDGSVVVIDRNDFIPDDIR